MAAETGLAEPQADYAKILGAKYTRAGTMVLTHEVDALTVSACTSRALLSHELMAPRSLLAAVR
jgi:hypothetical protein